MSDRYRDFMEIVGWAVFILRLVMEIARAVRKYRMRDQS